MRLSGTLGDVTTMLRDTGQRQPGTALWQGATHSSFKDAETIVTSDDASGHLLRITVSAGAYGWDRAATREGLGIGAEETRITKTLGEPSWQSTEGTLRTIFFGRQGIDFIVATTGPMARRVVGVHVVWPEAKPGDGMIVPGERISAVTLRMTLDDVFKTLGGGNTTTTVGDKTMYLWPHRGLRVLTKDRRVLSIGTFSAPFLEGAGVKYATANGLGVGSADARVRKILGEPNSKSAHAPLLWWLYDRRGLALGVDPASRVAMMEVFPPRGVPVSLLVRFLGAAAAAVGLLLAVVFYTTRRKQRRLLEPLGALLDERTRESERTSRFSQASRLSGHVQGRSAHFVLRERGESRASEFRIALECDAAMPFEIRRRPRFRWARRVRPGEFEIGDGELDATLVFVALQLSDVVATRDRVAAWVRQPEARRIIDVLLNIEGVSSVGGGRAVAGIETPVAVVEAVCSPYRRRHLAADRVREILMQLQALADSLRLAPAVETR